MSKEVDISLVRIPGNMSTSDIPRIYSRVEALPDEELLLLFNVFEHSLPTLKDEELYRNITEEDLFELGEEGQTLIRKKILVKEFAKESIRTVLMPFFMGSPTSSCGEIKYLKIESSYYAITGGESYRFSFSNSSAAKIKLLSATKILEERT
jgi:hypothetical protein